MPSSSYLKINLDAIQYNIRQFKRTNEVMAMVKANAYGAGAIHLIPFLKQCGVAMLGVSHVNEGVALRKAGIDLPIFVVSAPPFDAMKVAKYHLQPAVSSLDEIKALNQAAREKIAVHLDVNTGMNRFGAKPETVLKLAKVIQDSPNLQLQGVMTHFASADMPELDSFTYKQIALFKEIVDQLNPSPHWIHAANGPGAMRFSIPFCNLARIGVSLFGYGADHNLKPALTLESHLSFISTLKKGETVGYYKSYQVKQTNMRLGVIPFGYYDGLHRHYKEKGYVLIHGKQAAMVGNICMDFVMVDLSDIPEAQVGDTVTFFGRYLSPETVAGWGETDVRELLSNIGPRTRRVLIRKPRENDESRLQQAIHPIEESSPSR